MADETIDVRDATGGTQSIAVDTVSGAQYQRIKLDAGGDGSSVSITAGQQTAAASLPVVLATDGTLIPGTSASALGKAEDAAHTSGDVGVMALGVRKDTAAALAGTDGDYQPAIYDASGRLWTDPQGNVAHDAADSGNPLKIGGKASTSLPTAVASGDRADLWVGPSGQPIIGSYGAASGDAASATEAQLLSFANSPLRLGVYDYVYNGSTWDRQRSANADAAAVTGLAAAAGMRFNGTTWDREYGNQDALTALASAARTASTASAQLTNYNARGVFIVLSISVASGTGGLQVRVWWDSPSGIMAMNVAPTAVTATGRFGYVLYPGASATAPAATSSNIVQYTPAALPRLFIISVSHGDASSYTYGVSYALTN